MDTSELVRLLRGRAALRHRGLLVFGQPVLMALAVWAAIAATRLSHGPLPWPLALVGLFGPLAWLHLAVQRERDQPELPPSVRLLLARFAVVAVLASVALVAWAWLAPQYV